MSAPDGVCLHQIVGELEKIKKSMVMDFDGDARRNGMANTAKPY